MVKTGIARRDITPQESVPLFGYGDRTHDSTGIHDPLSVYAWWIEGEGEAPFAWVVLDLCLMGIGAARERAQACTIEAREAAGSLGVNRRDPRMPVDPRIILLSLVDAEGRLQGVLFHYSCHLTVLGVDNYLVSADWAGPVRSSLEAELGVPVAYLQGAEGNIDPLTRGFLDMSDPDQARGSSFEVLGGLAEGIISALRTGLRSAPVARGGARSHRAVEERVRRVPRHSRGRGPGRQDRQRAGQGEVQGTARLPCRILDFGGLCVLGAPLEILVEAAFDWQRRLAGRIALVSGLTGGWLGYMPHRSNFEEAEAGELYETVSTVFAPSACEKMLDDAQRRATGGKA